MCRRDCVDVEKNSGRKRRQVDITADAERFNVIKFDDACVVCRPNSQLAWFI